MSVAPHGGQGGRGAPGTGGNTGAERPPARPQPASEPPPPPAPLLSPTGNATVDAFGDIVNRTAAPWQNLPNQTPVQQVNTVVSGVVGLLAMQPAVDAFNMGFATLTGPLAAMFPALPAATLLMPHIGTPHTHTHPPSLVPPAPPIPLPSLGQVMVGGCVSVLIGGVPAARCGDLGMAFTCGSLSPAFEVFTGSSNVFIGGSRAARMGDITKHCGAAAAGGGFTKGGAAVTAGVAALGAASADSALAAAMVAAQAAADVAKMAASALLGKDPGAPPCIGAVMMGNPTVMIGGLPVPALEQFAQKFMQKLLKPLANALHSRIARGVGNARFRNFLHEVVCHTTGHPVDVASGKVTTSALDLESPGPIPVPFKRSYSSAWGARDSVLGWGWSHTLDQAIWIEDRQVVFKAGDGREIVFPDKLPRRDQVSREPGVPYYQSFDPFNRIKITSKDGRGWTIEMPDEVRWDFAEIPGAAGRAPLLLITDPSGNFVRFRYDPAGRLAEVLDATDALMRFQYDRAGRLVEVQVPHPSAASEWVLHRRFDYSPEGDLTSATNAAGHGFTYQYKNHLLTREIDGNGDFFAFEYDGGDATAYCTHTTGKNGLLERHLVYDKAGRTTVVIDSQGARTSYFMDADNAVVKVVHPGGATEAFEYDRYFRRTAATNALGQVTKHEYDKAGNPVATTYPDGKRVEMAYDEHGRLTKLTTEAGAEHQYLYNRHRKRTAIIDPLGQITRYEYDDHGFLRGVKKGERSVRVERDGAGLMVAMVRADGVRTTYAYDRLRRLVAKAREDGMKERYRHDAAGRIVEVETSDGIYRYDRDPGGRIVGVTRPDGGRTRLAYAAFHQKKRVTPPEGAELRFRYDRELNVVAIESGGAPFETYKHDVRGRVVARTDAAGRTWKYERDLLGRITAVTKPSGRRVKRKYDPRGNVVQIDYGQGLALDFEYDPEGALTKAAGGGHEVELIRDALGRVTRERQDQDWVASRFELTGQRQEMETSLGTKVAFTDDPAKSLRTISVGGPGGGGGGGGGAGAETGFAWTAAIRRAGSSSRYQFPGDVAVQWSPDQRGYAHKRTVSAPGGVQSSWTYHWRDPARLERIEYGPREWVDLRKDAIGRLRSAADQDGVEVYVSPAARDLLRGDVAAADRKDYPTEEEASRARGASVYVHDEEGRRVRRVDPDGSSWRYRYDTADRLVAVVCPDGREVKLEYDPLGRRVLKAAGEDATRWVWDGDRVVHELFADQAPAAWLYEPGQFTPLAKVQGGKRYAVVSDLVGTPTELYDEAGKLAWRARADLRGRAVSRKTDVARTACPWRFPGQYHDVETGLHYNRFRYYDPEAGRYLSPDPIGVGGGLSPYGYVGDPTMLIDPLGLEGGPCGRFYHATTDEGEASIMSRGVDLDAGQPNRDFNPPGGRAFYVTSDQADAHAWATRMAEQARRDGRTDAQPRVVAFDVPEGGMDHLNGRVFDPNSPEDMAAWRDQTTNSIRGDARAEHDDDYTRGPMLANGREIQNPSSTAEARPISGSDQMAVHTQEGADALGPPRSLGEDEQPPRLPVRGGGDADDDDW